jgi:FkbM family methyltransferase
MKIIKRRIRNLYERFLYFKLENKRLPTSAVVIDCGANIGKFTNVFAKKGVSVFAFEPNEYAFEVLKMKFQQMENVNLFQKAVWICEDKLPLFLHVNSSDDHVKWSTGSSLVSEKENVDNNKYKLTDTIDLSSFIKKLERRVSILKIDIEGAEIEVLNKLIDDKTYELCDEIYVETHPQIKGKRELLDQLIKRIRALDIKNIRLDWI